MTDLFAYGTGSYMGIGQASPLVDHGKPYSERLESSIQ